MLEVVSGAPSTALRYCFEGVGASMKIRGGFVLINEPRAENWLREAIMVIRGQQRVKREKGQMFVFIKSLKL